MFKDLHLWKLMFTLFVLTVLIGCASTGSPSGGPRDTIPPKLVVEKSPPNFATNYIPEDIQLVFNEWIELKNQQREILISPPFFKNPKITSRGKKVKVEFPKEEPLREDATYTINFGKSIVDFTEGNAAEGFRFVFATGDKIDSLELSGKIQDAINEEPVKDILVLLYDLVEDSVVVSEKPFYYARTDETGNFKFENLKNDTFKLLVLEDLNFNYLMDPELERIAFPDSLLILNDSSTYNPTLRLFKPEQRRRILNSSSQTPGVISTEFNEPAEKVDFEFLYPDDFDPMVERSEDTLLLWFPEPRDSVGIAYGVDTLDFTIKPFDSVFYSKKLGFINHNASKIILAPFDSLAIKFKAPIAKVDTSLIKLTNQPVTINTGVKKGDPRETPRGTGSPTKDAEPKGRGRENLKPVKTDTLVNDSLKTIVDSLPIDTSKVDLDIDSIGMNPDTIVSDTIVPDTLGVIPDSLNVITDSLGLDSTMVALDTAKVEFEFSSSYQLRKLFINSKWKEKFDYQMELLPGAVTDIYGRQNDTITFGFKTAALDEFGNIAINLTGMDSAQQYVVLLKLNDEVVKKTIVPDTSLKRIEHTRLRTNTYTIELIKDDDGNGEWTTGDYWLKRQPEELKTFTLEKLRENSDLEEDVFWNRVQKAGLDSLGTQRDSLDLNLPTRDLKKNLPPKRGSKGPPDRKPDPKGKND